MLEMIIPLVAIAVQDIRIDPGLGSCMNAGNRPIYLRRVMFLENRELDLDSSVGPVRLRLQRQTFTLELLNSADRQTAISDIGERVGRNNTTADVSLKFGLLEGRPVLYWRETYLHRSYRQGLFAIEPEAMRHDPMQVLKPLCEGRGGMDIYH